MLAGLAPELAETFVSVASDLALVIDLDGTIRSVAVSGKAAVGLEHDWVGRHWADTVTIESRPKVAQMLRDVNLAGVTRRRQVNHPGVQGTDVPVAYAVIRLGDRGPLLAVGHDQRPLAEIQQRFMKSQLQMERDVLRRRQADSRYRRLFQAVPDAVLVLDATTHRIVEANSASATLLGGVAEGLPGRVLGDLLELSARPSLVELLAAARDASAPIEFRTRLSADGPLLDLSVTPIRSEDSRQLLVRIREVDLAPPAADGAIRPIRPQMDTEPGAGA
jgi:transcriptional regulator PpsR